VHSGDQYLKFSIVVKSAGKNRLKIKEKQKFLRKIGFRQKWILVFGVTIKK